MLLRLFGGLVFFGGMLIFSNVNAQTSSTVMLTAQRVRTKGDVANKREPISLCKYTEATTGNKWVSAPVEVDFTYSSQTVVAGIRNAGKVDVSCELQVLFFSEERETKECTVQQHIRQDLRLKVGENVSKRFTSPTNKFTRAYMMVDKKKTKMGSEPFGYLVLLSDKNGPFKWVGSPEVTKQLQTAEKITKVIEDGKLVSQQDANGISQKTNQ